MLRRRFLADHRSAPGPFYVVAGRSAGEGAADWIESGAYFKKQPEDDAGIAAVIAAMQAAPAGAVRYAGNDSAILDRLRSLGLEGACDIPQLAAFREGGVARVFGWSIARIPGPWLQAFGRAIAKRLKAR